MYAPRQEKVKASCPACQATVTSWHEEDLIEQKGHCADCEVQEAHDNKEKTK